MIAHFTRTTLILFSIAFFYQSSQAQDFKIFQNLEEGIINEENLFISPDNYRTINLDEQIFAQKTSHIPHETDVKAINSPVVLTFPMPDGTEEEFKVVEYSIMESGLAAAFPNIKTYHGVGVKNPHLTVRFDYTSHGLRAVLRLENEMVYIDPVDKNNPGNSICYYRKDLVNEEVHTCHIADELTEEHNQTAVVANVKAANCGFSKYTLAVAATAEYSAYYNATSAADEALVLSAITTSINRVNEIYERDLGIRLVLVNNMETLFYYDAASDPYTNSTPSIMLDENQANITSVIGANNYDVGHVLSTSPGGVASVNSPCREDYKARGVTGLSTPQGDVFDIDFLSHEIGHQFGAMHTFNNSCSNNVSWESAVEPGSGSTIMSYAGTCAPNVQANSDAYFHAVSLSQINAFLNSGVGSSCNTIIASSNSQPAADAGINFTIPSSTPFYLKGSATDVDGDALTFCWEQMDMDSSVQSPVNTSLGGPTFRSYLPSTDSVRYFPNLTDLSTGGASTWEVLPAVSRDLNFRMTVRDNNTASAGCFAYDDMVVSVDATAGPFLVNIPNNAGITWIEGDRQTVTWDVANTDASPINCSKVDILLSYDGGLSYPTTLVTNVDNDGSVIITVPAGTTTAGRIMVKSVGNVFFDISDNDFSIAAGSPDFSLSVLNPEHDICGGYNAIYDITVGSISGFAETILLSVSDAPSGVSVSFASNPVTAGQTTQLTISGTNNPAVADYTMTLNGTSIDSGTSSSPKGIDFNMNLGAMPGSTIQTSPSNNEEDISLRPTFTWNATTSAMSYELQVSTDPSFSTVNQSGETSTISYTLTEDLSSATSYFWRVRGVAECGGGPWSIPLRFTTYYCTSYVQEADMPVNDGGDAYSDLFISDIGSIASLEVLDVVGTHTWVEDITATLISPSNTEVTLWSGLCNSKNDFSLNLKDNAALVLADVTCDPLGGGEEYQPQNPLSNFGTENLDGTWRLKLNDNWAGETGTLQNWSLKICIEGYVAVAQDQIEVALPVELFHFNVRPNEKNILMAWEATQEKNIAGYGIERRILGAVDFQEIGLVEVENNQGAKNKYSFKDELVGKGIVYEYRLRMLNYSGDISYSKVKSTKIEAEGLTMNVYPNPARGSVSVDLWGEREDNIKVEIIDIAGKRLAEYNLHPGSNSIDIASYSSGIYIIRTKGMQTFIQQKLVVN